MPKFLVTMNYVEAKRASFVIEANSEDDVRDGLGELDTDFFENIDNVKWVCSDYEPPIVDDVQQLSKKNSSSISCSADQQNNIQKEFNKIIEELSA